MFFSIFFFFAHYNSLNENNNNKAKSKYSFPPSPPNGKAAQKSGFLFYFSFI
jgi:hypothetical protein